MLTRALYVWSHRHRATGYVQGMNDLITPFVYVFLNHSTYNTHCYRKKGGNKNKNDVMLYDCVCRFDCICRFDCV